VYKFILSLFLYILWDLVIICGTGYVVFWLNQSGWWFLLALILLRFPSESEGDIKASNVSDTKL